MCELPGSRDDIEEPLRKDVLVGRWSGAAEDTSSHSSIPRPSLLLAELLVSGQDQQRGVALAIRVARSVVVDEQRHVDPARIAR